MLENITLTGISFPTTAFINIAIGLIEAVIAGVGVGAAEAEAEAEAEAGKIIRAITIAAKNLIIFFNTLQFIML